MSAVIQYELKKNIAVITVDNPPVNALSQAVRQGLVDCVQRLNEDENASAGILICSGRTFIAGADISEFSKPPMDPLLPEVIEKLESSEKIIVVAIHGTALGGGFETAMACHYRCALSTARVGLPEVKLGLIPGATGTQRLPRLIGIESAIKWMVSGEHIGVDEAYNLGAIDRIIKGDLLGGATEFTNELLDSGASPIRLSQHTLSTESENFDVLARHRIEIDEKYRGYFSPQKIIDCVEASLTQPYHEAVRLERKLFNECKASSQSRALRNLFFAERQVAKVPGLSADTPARDIKKVAVVGAGTMGSGITVALLNAGLPVYLTDMNEAGLDAGVNKIKNIFQSELKKGNLSGDLLNERLSNLSTTLDMSHLQDVDLFIEAISEDLEAKRALFNHLQSIGHSNAIMATNTSTLDINTIAESFAHPECLVGMHFFAPAHKMKLLEIVRSDSTADDVLVTALKMARRLDKIGVVVKSAFGFVGNRVFLPYIREAQLMVLQGEAPSRIDSVAREWGFAMGPLSVMDLSGLDIFYSIYQQLDSKPGKYAYHPLCVALYEDGRLGRKNNKGFYRYLDGEQLEDPDVMDHARLIADKNGISKMQCSDDEIIDRLIFAIINEAGYVLEDGVASRPGDIDVILTNGYGFPRYRGGPLFYADIRGLDVVRERIREYDKTLQENIWTPPGLLDSMVNKGESFYST